MQSLFEQFGGTYHNESDYSIPSFTICSNKETNIGIYGQQHLIYLQEYCKLTYINLLTCGKLYQYLADIDNQANQGFFRIVEQMKQEQEITEQLKEHNLVEWIRKMNCIRQQANEIVFTEIIYK